MMKKISKTYSKFDLKTNIERVLEILEKIKDQSNDGKQIRKLQW